MKLLVSIHDVTPAYEASVRALWQMCARRDITPALLVVPNWHGRWPLARSFPFVAWMRARARDGANVFLHGERHDEVASPRTLRDSFRALGRTNAEGEFLTLSTEEASERIARGLRCLHECDLEPIGFVPPAWLSRDGLTRAVTESGLRLSEDERAVFLHDRDERIEAPVTRWSARSRWRADASAAVARLRLRAGAGAPYVRVALHPQDLHSPRVRMSIEQTLDRWLVHHQPWSYAEL